MHLTRQQQEQENDYKNGPYHWFINNKTVDGRIYFGYLNICKDFLKFQKLSQLNILDAGCGDGRFCKELLDIGVKKITGVDYSAKAISFARLLAPEVKFEIADLVNLPIEDSNFDYVYCIETLEHIIPTNIVNILKEFDRVLKVDGRLIVTVPSLLNGEPGPTSKHYQHFTVKSLTKTLEPFFEIEKIFGQDMVGFHILKIVYKMIDNKYWEIKLLKRFYNIHIWPRFFNYCHAKVGRRLVAICKKKHFI